MELSHHRHEYVNSFRYQCNDSFHRSTEPIQSIVLSSISSEPLPDRVQPCQAYISHQQITADRIAKHFGIGQYFSNRRTQDVVGSK